ncbi:MAG: cold shock domain-containing protein [Lewinellaceae bacterium]|nr:cold shock domain-containing protein [Lewinellaceae bacterium]
MPLGLIKWYEQEKGFGVIGADDGAEYFLHSSNIQQDKSKIESKLPILFDQGYEKGKLAAKRVRLPNSFHDFNTLVALFFTEGQSDIIQIEERVLKYGYRGKPYRRNESISYRISERTLIYLLQEQGEEGLLAFFARFINHDNKSLAREISSKFFWWVNSFINTNRLSDGSKKGLNTFFRNYYGDHKYFDVWNKGEEDTNRNFLIDRDLILHYEKELSNEALSKVFSFSRDNELQCQLIELRISRLKNTFDEGYFRKLHEVVTTQEENLDLAALELFSNYSQELAIAEVTALIEPIESIITIEATLNDYEKGFREITEKFFFLEEDKAGLKNYFAQALSSKCDNELKFKLFLKGYDFQIDDNLIISRFEKGDSELQKSVLRRCSKRKELQKFLFTSILSPERISEGYTILSDLLISMNAGLHSLSKEDFINDEYWQDKDGSYLRSEFIHYYRAIEDPALNCKYFLEGFLSTFPREHIISNAADFDEHELGLFFQAEDVSQSFILDSLSNYISSEKRKLSEKDSQPNYDFLTKGIGLSNEFLDEPQQGEFIKQIEVKFPNDAFVDLWLDGLVKNFPKSHLLDMAVYERLTYERLIRKVSPYEEKEKLIATLEQRVELQQKVEIVDRPTFYRAYWTFWALLRLLDVISEKPHHEFRVADEKYRINEEISEFAQTLIDKYLSGSYPLQKIILWLLDLTDDFDFEFLKRKFIYFSPEDQVLAMKKLFKVREKGSFELTVDKLDEILRVSYDIYKINEKLHPEIPMDLTTDLVISALHSFKKKGKFLFEDEVFEVLVRNLANDKTRKFKLKDYFERCRGRTTSKINLHKNNGTIKKIPFGKGRHYFGISFDYDEGLVEEVRKLPGRKWNKEEKIWGVPSRYEKEVIAFAREHQFLLDFEGNDYDNNPHLAVQQQEDVPDGITFCEGRIANKLDRQQKVPFYWCCNQPCFQLCETEHSHEDWKNYSFLDFCRILGFNVDEVNPYGPSPNGKYYTFIGLINRFNRLLDRLYCTECNHILYPALSSNYAYHRVVRFTCKNESCSLKKIVYLHHCLNGRCNSIIDSRVSGECPHGLVICENCLSCCSHKMLSQRLENLRTTGGYIHPELIHQVGHKLGHMERGIHFCYKCEVKMEYLGNEVFKCPSCHIEKDLSAFLMTRRQNFKE